MPQDFMVLEDFIVQESEAIQTLQGSPFPKWADGKFPRAQPFQSSTRFQWEFLQSVKHLLNVLSSAVAPGSSDIIIAGFSKSGFRRF